VTLTVDNGSVYIPSSASGGGGGKLFKLDANTGNLIFNVTIPGFGGSSSIMASATVGAGMVFVRAQNRYNYALNATTGDIIWMVDARYNLGTPEQAASVSQVCAMLYKYGRVYFNDYYGISCVNAFNGSELWHTWLGRENMAQGLSYSYGRIYTVNENGVLYVLDSLTGEKLSYYAFVGGGAELHSMPTPYNCSLYVASLNWNLYCFEEAPPAEPWTPTPEPTFPTADEIAQKVLDNLPDSPSANDIAQEIVNQLPAYPEYPEAPTADEVAQKVLDNLPDSPSADEVAQAVVNTLPEEPEPAEAPEYTTIDLAILVAVVIAIAIELVSFWTLKKRK